MLYFIYEIANGGYRIKLLAILFSPCNKLLRECHDTSMMEHYKRIFLINKLPVLDSFAKKSLTPSSFTGDIRELYTFAIFLMISFLGFALLTIVAVVLWMVWIGALVMLYEILLIATFLVVLTEKLFRQKNKAMPLGLLSGILLLIVLITFST